MEAINVEGNADQRSKRVAVQTRRNVGRRGAGATASWTQVRCAGAMAADVMGMMPSSSGIGARLEQGGSRVKRQQVVAFLIRVHKGRYFSYYYVEYGR